MKCLRGCRSLLGGWRMWEDRSYLEDENYNALQHPALDTGSPNYGTHVIKFTMYNRNDTTF